MSDPIPCEYCGQEFTPHQHNQRFCSARCKERARMGVTQIELKCPVCGKEFTTCNPHDKYCSRECRLMYQRAMRKRKRMLERGEDPGDIQVHLRAPKVMGHPRVCQECGKEFLAKSVDTKYCSERCRNRHYDRKRTVAKNLAAYAAEIDGKVAEAQASWGSDYPSMGEDEIYGNMVAL